MTMGSRFFQSLMIIFLLLLTSIYWISTVQTVEAVGGDDINVNLPIPNNFGNQSALQHVSEPSIQQFGHNGNSSTFGYRSSLRGLHRRGRGKKRGGRLGRRCRVPDGTKCQFSRCGRGRRLPNCAIGFAAGVVGGRRGVSYVVTRSDDNLYNPNPGSLRYGINLALTNPGGVWITFSSDMTICLQNKLFIYNHTTIDGRGVRVVVTCNTIAPLRSHNIILHNFQVSGIPGFDTVHIFQSSKVWVDHLTCYDGTTGLVSAVQGSTDITISNCRLSNNHYNMLLGSADSDTIDKIMRVTIYRNWFRNSHQRMPHCRWGFCHVANNLYMNWKNYAIGGRVHAKIYSEMNVFVPGITKEATEWFEVFAERGWDTSITIQSKGDLLLNGATLHEFLPNGRLGAPPYRRPRNYPPLVNTARLARLIGRCSGVLLPRYVRTCFLQG